jgi:hypothetical protein
MNYLRYDHGVNISIDNYHLDTIVWNDKGHAIRAVIINANFEYDCEAKLMTSDISSFTNMIDLINDLKRDIDDISKIKIFGKSEKDKELILKALSR